MHEQDVPELFRRSRAAVCQIVIGPVARMHWRKSSVADSTVADLLSPILLWRTLGLRWQPRGVQQLVGTPQKVRGTPMGQLRRLGVGSTKLSVAMLANDFAAQVFNPD